MDEIPAGYKQCKKCGEIKAVEQFRKSQGYFRNGCKQCERKYDISYQKKNRDTINANRRKYQQENREKFLTRKRIYREANREELRQKALRYYHENQEEVRRRAKIRYHENPEKFRQDSQKNYLKRKEKHLAYSRKYREENREKYLAGNKAHYEKTRERRLIQSREYKKTEHGKKMVLTQNTRREARKRGLPNTFTLKDYKRCIEYFDNACAVCGRKEDEQYRLALDHWICLTNPDCPGTVPENMIPLCHPKHGGKGACNLTKYTKDPDVWLKERYGDNQAKIISARIQEYFTWVKNQDSNLEN